MLRAILNKSRRQHPTNQHLYGHLPPITKTIQDRRTRHAGHCQRIKDVLISDILLWTPSHGRAKAERSARAYIQQLSVDTGYSFEDLQATMDDRNGWRERVREIHAGGETWWWWYLVRTITFLVCLSVFQELWLLLVSLSPSRSTAFFKSLKEDPCIWPGFCIFYFHSVVFSNKKLPSMTIYFVC